MSKSFAAPRTIRRIAARRVFQSANGKPVVLTIGVPQSVPGSDWGCALQITGLNTSWRRPRYVFGIDGLQALHLAMKCADAVVESTKPRLAWLGQEGDLGMPKVIPDLPKPQKDRLQALVEREALRFWKSVERAHKANVRGSRDGPGCRQFADKTCSNVAGTRDGLAARALNRVLRFWDSMLFDCGNPLAQARIVPGVLPDPQILESFIPSATRAHLTHKIHGRSVRGEPVFRSDLC
jgi:hypothetical protein